MLDNTPDTLTLKELEEFLQIRKTSALRLVNEGILAGHKICGKWIFLKKDMLAWTFDECRGGIYRKVYGLRRESAEKPLKTLFFRAFQRK